MFLAPDGDEIEIANAAAGFLAERMSIERLHITGSADLGDDLRRELGGMGWFALAVAESEGGSGLSAVEHALFFREIGRQCGPVDVLAQVLAATASGGGAGVEQLLAGERGVALIVDDGAGYRVIGHPQASQGVYVERDRARVYALDHATREARPALDPVNSMQTLAELPASLVVERAGGGIWRLGELGIAAMLLGIAEAALDLAVDYAKIRETFGRKIGSYQAVRHPCADMAVRAEAARSQLWYAATAIKEERTDAELHLDAAKHLANEAAVRNADVNIQVHGGIGVTDEHHAHLMLKHALVLAKLFGSKRALLSRILDARLDD